MSWSEAARPPTLRLNASSGGKTGRRPGLSRSAAERIVRRWIDDALERLFTLEWSCALDVVEAYPDGLATEAVGAILGIRKQTAQELQHTPRVLAAMRELEELHDG